MMVGDQLKREGSPDKRSTTREPSMKSKKPPGRRASEGTASSPGRHGDPERAVVLDFVQSRIEAFNDQHGGGVAVRKDPHGYTLSLLDNGKPLARLRPRESGDRFEVLCWNPFRERWQPVGPYGGMILSLVDALEFIANDPMECFWR
jgi:hypothetical protein